MNIKCWDLLCYCMVGIYNLLGMHYMAKYGCDQKIIFHLL